MVAAIHAVIAGESPPLLVAIGASVLASDLSNNSTPLTLLKGSREQTSFDSSLRLFSESRATAFLEEVGLPYRFRSCDPTVSLLPM